MEYYSAIKNNQLHPGEVAHVFTPSTWEAEPGKFKASLVYIVSSRTARAKQRNPVSKNQNPKTKKKPTNQTKKTKKKKKTKTNKQTNKPQKQNKKPKKTPTNQKPKTKNTKKKKKKKKSWANGCIWRISS
jgi:outer membrane biosynthesis protein TonB